MIATAVAVSVGSCGRNPFCKRTTPTGPQTTLEHFLPRLLGRRLCSVGMGIAAHVFVSLANALRFVCKTHSLSACLSVCLFVREVAAFYTQYFFSFLCCYCASFSLNARMALTVAIRVVCGIFCFRPRKCGI